MNTEVSAEGRDLIVRGGERRPPQLAVGLFSYQIGGSERIGADVAIGYKRRGYSVFCFAFYDSSGPVRERLEQEGVECLDVNYLIRPRGVRRRIAYQMALARLLRARRVSAFHVHHTTSLILGGLASRAARVNALLMTEHAVHELEADRRYKRDARLYCRLAHKISVVHPGLVAYFRDEIGVPVDRLEHVPNGVAIPSAAACRETRARVRGRSDADRSEFLFLFAGRLHVTKDLPTLVRAARVVRDTRRFRLWLVGDGPERRTLESMVAELGLGDTVEFLGAASDVSPYFSSADAFVMSSETEGLPMVLLEAAANRLPCIATAVGGIPELLSGGRGIVVPPREPAQLAEAMVRLMDDAALRQEIVRLGFEKVSREFDLERVIDRYLGLLGLPPRWPRSLSATE